MCAQDPPLTQWYTNYAAIAHGAGISSPSKLHGGFEIEGVIGGKDFPQGRDSVGVVFADNATQREEFTIDLGQTRKLGMIVFECELARRTPKSLRIEISDKSASGPWKTALSTTNVLQYHTIGIDDETPARWIHVDLGERGDGRGSRIRRIYVYPRYHLKPARELIQEFSKRYRRDAPGFEAFWKAIDAKKWDAACDVLIKHYAERGRKLREDSRKANMQAPERAQMWMENRVEDGGHVYQFDSADWNWRALAPGAPTPNLGMLPGAYSIFNDLANAYLYTGESRYAKQAAALVKDWIQDNPYPGATKDEDNEYVMTWSGLTTGGRCSIFSKMVDTFFAENRAFTRDLKINLLHSIWQHMAYLRAIRKGLGGNWLTNANSGLFGNALDFPEFVESKGWLQDSLGTFEISLMRDVFPCGREVEDSTQYVPIATGQMTGQYVKMRENGLKLSDEAERRASLLWDAIAWMGYPDGSGPCIGDCFRISPLRKGQKPVPEDYLKLFDRPDLAYINSQGKEGKAPVETARAFAGWYVMKSGWDAKPYEDMRHLFFKCSENRTHSHRDQLQVTLCAYGREILTDPGMVGYGLAGNEIYSGTAYHNTLCVNGLDQDEKEGEEKGWAPGKDVTFADAQFHCGTVFHRRQVVYLRPVAGMPDYWLVHDRVNGRVSEHTLDVNYHLAEGAAPVVDGRSARTMWADGGNLLLVGAGDSPAPTLEDYVILDRLRGPVPAKCVRYRAKATPPARLDTFLVPYKGTAAPQVTALELTPDQPDSGKSASAFEVTTASGKDILVVSAEPGRKIAFAGGKLITDAQAVVLRFDRDAKLVCAFQYGGAETSYGGKSVISIKPGEAFAEWTMRN